MAIVGAVEIDLVARVARLQSDLDKATGLIKGFKDKSVQHFDGMSRAAENVGRSITAMVSVAGLSMLANFTKNVADETDQLINQAKYLGISTDKLSAFQHMALLSGVSTESMTEALGKFSKNLGSAADGTGPVADKIRSLGLSIEKLQALAPDEAFLQIGEAIGKLSTSSEKAAATVAIFGRSSIGLVNVFDNVRGNLSDASDEVDKFHLSISKNDEAKIQALDDAFDRLGQSVKGASRSIVVEFADGLKKTVDFVSELIANRDKLLASPSKRLGIQLFEPYLSKGTIDRSGSGPVDSPKSAMASPGFTADQWQKVLNESEKNYQALYGISDKYWQQLLARSWEGYDKEIEATNSWYEGELERIAIGQDSQIELYRNHYANLDAEHAVHLEKWRADEEALSMDMGAIWEAQQQNEERINQMRLNAQQAQFSSTASILGALSSLTEGHSKKEFQVSKAFARAQTIINTYAAATRHAAETPYPLSIAVVASDIAMGLANLNRINETSFSGGGSIANSTGGAAGGTPTNGAASAPSSPTPQPQQPTPIHISINVNGSVVGVDLQEIIVNSLSDYVGKDGVFMNGDNAQARVIAQAAA
jgi:hypothetical protein